MNYLRLIAAVSVAAALTGAASPGFAMTGECFWGRLSPATRDAFLRGYARLGEEVLDRVAVSDEEYAGIDSACGADAADPAIKDRLLAATVIEHGAAVFLQGRLGWDAPAVQLAWDRLGPEQLDRLHDQALQALRGEAREADVTGAARRFLGERADGDRDVLDQARAYLTGRAMRETIERSDRS